MFRIVFDPSSGSIELYLTEIVGSGSLMFVVCLVGVWQRNFEPVVCECVFMSCVCVCVLCVCVCTCTQLVYSNETIKRLTATFHCPLKTVSHQGRLSGNCLPLSPLKSQFLVLGSISFYCCLSRYANNRRITPNILIKMAFCVMLMLCL